MADNVTIDPGVTPSVVVATDDGGAGGHVQLFKLAYSANGSVTLVSADASGLMVQLGAALPAGANAIGTVSLTSVVPGTAATNLGKAEDAVHTTGDTGVMALAVRADTAASTAANGDYVPLLTDSVGRLHTASVLTTLPTGGYSVSRLVSAATTNATSVKASAGQVYGWYISNANAAARFFKLYNKASAPTVGTDTPFMTIPIPGNGATNINWPHGIAMGTGIAYAITSGIADADTGAISASETAVNLMYV